MSPSEKNRTKQKFNTCLMHYCTIIIITIIITVLFNSKQISLAEILNCKLHFLKFFYTYNFHIHHLDSLKKTRDAINNSFLYKIFKKIFSNNKIFIRVILFIMILKALKKFGIFSMNVKPIIFLKLL